jgi:hypothetical protein
MKKNVKKVAFCVSFLGLLLLGCENDSNQKSVDQTSPASRTTALLPTQDLLWNSTNGLGVTKRNFVHLNCTETTCNDEKAIQYLSDLSALIPGKPANIWPFNYPVDNFTDENYDGQQDGIISATDLSVHSLRLISLGYNNSNFGEYPGFAIDVYGGYDGQPITFNNKNMARTMENPNNLREVGLLFDHWPGPYKINDVVQFDTNGDAIFNDGNWAFKKNYRLGNFNEIKGNFSAKLNYFYTNLSGIPNSVYATADFRIGYYSDTTGELIREDLLGVIYYTGNSFDLNGNSTDEIYWKDFTTLVNGKPSHRILLRAGASQLATFGINTIGANNIPSNNFTNIVIPFKELVYKYLSPPTGYTINDAIIVGYDVYTHTRGYDLEVGLKNVRLVGYTN